jgi:DNA-binding protein HU-beta
MKKNELVAAVAEKTGMTKKDTLVFVDTVLDTITDALVAGDKVSLVGFGAFSVRSRAARIGVNPAAAKAGKKEPLAIGKSNVPSFKAGRNLKEAVKDVVVTEE